MNKIMTLSFISHFKDFPILSLPVEKMIKNLNAIYPVCTIPKT